MLQQTASHILSGLLAPLLVGLLVAGCGDSKGKNANPAGRAGGATVPVEVLVIQPQPLQNTIVTTGTLLANEEVELRPEISGRVTQVLFQEGKRVKKGELLLKINDRELKAELTRKGLEEKLAAEEEARKRHLHDINGISQEEYDKALNMLKVIQAEKEVIQSQLAETEIIAPFDGVVGLRYVSEGGYVTPEKLAATMQDIDPVKAEFSIPEKYAGLLKEGLKVQVQVGDNTAPNIGTVYAVESKIDPGTRTIKARARIPNPDGSLVPGSFARIEITLEELPNALVIPTSAILPELAGEKVYVVKGDKAKAVRVQTGIRTEQGIQVTSGLNINDTLIVTGLLQLADGKSIQIKSASAN